MRIEYDKHKFFKEEKFINDWFDYFLYEGEYIYYIPNRVECKKYPIDFQLLFNKIMDIFLFILSAKNSRRIKNR